MNLFLSSTWKIFAILINGRNKNVINVIIIIWLLRYNFFPNIEKIPFALFNWINEKKRIYNIIQLNILIIARNVIGIELLFINVLKYDELISKEYLFELLSISIIKNKIKIYREI